MCIYYTIVICWLIKQQNSMHKFNLLRAMELFYALNSICVLKGNYNNSSRDYVVTV